MKEKKVTQKALADAIGISPQAVSRIVNGETSDPRKLPLIAKTVGASPEFLLGEVDDPNEGAPVPVLSNQEIAVLSLFNSLESSGQKAVIEIMRTMAQAALASPASNRPSSRAISVKPVMKAKSAQPQETVR
ncbi:helix-turn-helix domain-containing protein [Novosphingobium humi]|uniref:Helix-turn-helix transcriptional regulator n=1 Tax=Novosphingobium humi TaxID=2282397 RepID=A0ABY7U221_9SPHN|nr:helix-turn-helix transcriptional regulator [Novosphingobium humi]WCT78640.1 helix-turn-helix transcriptional regulator [Novosphingobium humi]